MAHMLCSLLAITFVQDPLRCWVPQRFLFLALMRISGPVLFRSSPVVALALAGRLGPSFLGDSPDRSLRYAPRLSCLQCVSHFLCLGALPFRAHSPVGPAGTSLVSRPLSSPTAAGKQHCSCGLVMTAALHPFHSTTQPASLLGPSFLSLSDGHAGTLSVSRPSFRVAVGVSLAFLHAHCTQCCAPPVAELFADLSVAPASVRGLVLSCTGFAGTTLVSQPFPGVQVEVFFTLCCLPQTPHIAFTLPSTWSRPSPLRGPSGLSCHALACPCLATTSRMCIANVLLHVFFLQALRTAC